MGKFNHFIDKLFKKNKETDIQLKSRLLSKYQDYILNSVQLFLNGDYAPIAAYEKPDGEIIGCLYLNDDETPYVISVTECLNRMQQHFDRELTEGKIKSYTIYYHSQFDQNEDYSPALNEEEFRAITIRYNFENKHIGHHAFPYKFNEDKVSFEIQDEFQAIFNHQLDENKDYFQEKEIIKAPRTNQNNGLSIIKANNGEINNSVAGLLGFDNDISGIYDVLLTHTNTLPTKNQNNFTTTELDYPEITIKNVTLNPDSQYILPIIKTKTIINIENKEITEWENLYNTVAIIKGQGKDTFTLDYLATDYIENANRYQSTTELNCHISGLAFVIDIRHEPSPQDPPFSEDFTGYMPCSQLPHHGCIDFIGQLKNFQAITLLDGKLNGYILTIKLINHPDDSDMFTIDVFANKENMRITELKQDMILTGAMQLQGKIAD